MAHGNGPTCIREEKLATLMKKIFAEELEKQQQSISKLINVNFEITMKEIKNKCEVNELKKASDLQRRFLKKKFRKCRGKLA